MKSEEYAKRLIDIATRNHKDAGGALDGFLDYLLDVFELSNQQKYDFDYTKMFLAAKERSEEYFYLMADWFAEVTQEMDKGKSLDFFGKMYEETWKGKGKASALGQFYTPEGICSLMTKMTMHEDGRMVNDCACGSGRTLLAAFEESDKSTFHYYDAGDIDYISCKMCALNFMVHGMIGEVKQQDALTLETPHVIYMINEVRYPFPTNMYSIRRVYPSATKTERQEEPKKAVKQKFPKKESAPKKPVQLSLF